MQEAVFVQSHRRRGTSWLTPCTSRCPARLGEIQPRKLCQSLRPGNMVQKQPSHGSWKEEHAGKVANVRLCPCKACLRARSASHSSGASEAFSNQEAKPKLSKSSNKTWKYDKKPLRSTGQSTVIMPMMPMLCNKLISIPKAHVVVKSTDAFAVTFDVMA